MHAPARRTLRTLTLSMFLAAVLTPARVSGQEEPALGVSLHAASLQGDLETVRRHIEAGSDLDAKDAYGSTSLMIAATFGRTAVARALIDAGADLHITNSDGATPLHVAAFLCRGEIVDALLDAGANRYARDNYGSTPLQSVSAPFERVEAVYDRIAQALAPLGLELDYDEIRAARPRIAALLRPRPEELDAIDYAPVPGRGWAVSSPAEQGLDPMLVARLYWDATGLATLYGVLVVKNGQLIAERYFNDGSIDRRHPRQSITKSYTSALVGLALQQGRLESVDQKMVDFFPELADRIADPRKNDITIGHLLEMRGGYPDEEYDRQYLDSLFLTDNFHWIPRLVDFPLLNAPGAGFNYSNLTSHLLAVIVARAVGTDLRSYAQEHLFSPIDAEVGEWATDADGYHFGCFEISVTARDMARFGLLYLHGGAYGERQVLPADWVDRSLERHSQGIRRGDQSESTLGRHFRDVGYGYQWWSATVGDHAVDYAAGHGGQLIVLVHDLEMIVVTTADPLYELPGGEGWRFEGPIVDLVGRFIETLPDG
jgi:CubicO group peptidase (beta-lactamase class C family)